MHTRVPGLLAGGAVAVLVLGSPAAVAPAPAADVSCQGRSPTIVGTPGELVKGTDGPDVIVSNGAADVYAMGGADLVCLTPGPDVSPDGFFVDLAAGDDMLDATAVGSTTVGAVLGAGADSYLGGAGADIVDAGRWLKDIDGFGPDHDVVVTGSGPDRVTTGSRRPFADTDDVDLGSGADTLQVFGDTAEGFSTSGGPGLDAFFVERATRSGTWLLDNMAGRARVKGVTVARWDGLESFVVSRLPVGSKVRFVGGAGPERLAVSGPTTSASMGAGDDVVEIEGGRRLLTEGLWADAGTGRDRLRLEGADWVYWKLHSGYLAFSADGPTTHNSRARGFEDADVVATSLQLTGSLDDDVLRYAACEGFVAARDGDDTVVFTDGGADWGCLVDGEVSVRGGIGDDTLVGGPLDDDLDGGPGHDSADGRLGADTCRAETLRRCEA